MTNLIMTEQQKNVYIIILNRTDKKNALNTEMYRQLSNAFTYASETKSIHSVLIRGNQHCFCAGNDLKDFIENAQDTLQVIFDFINIITTFDKPLIAAVAGPAVGIGTTLLLHCDMIIAADNSKFKLPFTQLSLCPEAGSTFLLPLLIGHQRAFELMALGKTFSAEQALSYGLINEVCLAEELITKAEHLATTLASLPQDALMTTRKLMRQQHAGALEVALENECEQFKRLLNTEQCKQTLAAFFT